MEVHFVKDIGTQVRKARKRLGLKQADAAGLLGVGIRFLSELERGKESLEVGRVLRVLLGLGLSVNVVDPHSREAQSHE